MHATALRGDFPMSEMRKTRQWILRERPRGPVQEGCFELKETAIGDPEDGQLLIRNLMLSFDPTQRGPPRGSPRDLT